MKTSIVLMTPEFADTLLKNNNINRKIRPTWVRTLVERIKLGEWLVTHQGIAISKKGDVLDGQHRLIAISQSKISVEVMLSTECEENTFLAIDRGVVRSISDVTKYNKRTVEVLRGFINFMNWNGNPSPQQVIGMYEKIGIEADYVNSYAPTSKKTFTSVGVRCAIVMLYKIGKKEPIDTYRKLTLSEFDGISIPMKAFVKQAIENRLSPTSLGLGGSGTQLYIYTKSLFCFDPKNKDKKTISVDEKMIEDARDLTKSFLA